MDVTAEEEHGATWETRGTLKARRRNQLRERERDTRSLMTQHSRRNEKKRRFIPDSPPLSAQSKGWEGKGWFQRKKNELSWQTWASVSLIDAKSWTWDRIHPRRQRTLESRRKHWDVEKALRFIMDNKQVQSVEWLLLPWQPVRATRRRVYPFVCSLPQETRPEKGDFVAPVLVRLTGH